MRDYYGNEMVEHSNSNGNGHEIENDGKRLRIRTSLEFSTSVIKLAEASGKSVEEMAQLILLNGTQLQEKRVFDHCDVVLVEFTDSKVCRMRGFRNKKHTVAL
jgi:hypothetical protein